MIEGVGGRRMLERRSHALKLKENILQSFTQVMDGFLHPPGLFCFNRLWPGLFRSSGMLGHRILGDGMLSHGLLAMGC